MQTIIPERLQLHVDHRYSRKHHQQPEKWKLPKLFIQTLLKELHIRHASQVNFNSGRPKKTHNNQSKTFNS